MKRESIRTPGWDCIFASCTEEDPCQTEPPLAVSRASPRNHGIHGEEWRYLVTDDDRQFAISLTVFTDILPPSVPPDHHDRSNEPLAERRRGVDLTLHIAQKTGQPCNYVATGFCDHSYTSGIQADALFRSFGDPTEFEQPERLWHRLEELHAEKVAAAEVDPELLWKECSRRRWLSDAVYVEVSLDADPQDGGGWYWEVVKNFLVVEAAGNEHFYLTHQEAARAGLAAAKKHLGGV